MSNTEQLKAQGYVFYWIRYQVPEMRVNSFTSTVYNQVRTVAERSVAHKPTDTIGEWKKHIVTHAEDFQHLSPSQLRIMDDNKEREFPDHMTVAAASATVDKGLGIGYGYFYAIPR